MCGELSRSLRGRGRPHRRVIDQRLCETAVQPVAFARQHGNLQGQVFALFIVTVAACEAGLALALILMLYRRSKSLDVSLWQDLREAGQEPAVDSEPLPPPAAEEPMPHLVPTGAKPSPSRGGKAGSSPTRTSRRARRSSS